MLDSDRSQYFAVGAIDTQPNKKRKNRDTHLVRPSTAKLAAAAAAAAAEPTHLDLQLRP